MTTFAQQAAAAEPVRATSRTAIAAAVAIGSAIAFLGYFFQIANLFYRTGAYFWDTGWYAYIMSIASFPPANPPVFVERGIRSYFSFHIAPIMSLWGTLSSPFSLPPGISYAVFQGTAHALLFLLGFFWLRPRGRTAAGWVPALLLGLLFAFNPFTLSAITYPHTEIALPVLLLLFAFLAGRGRPLAAALAFVLLLTVRGDAGFHAACFLWTFAIAELLSKRAFTPAARFAALYGAAGFVYSVAAFLFQNAYFPEFDNLRTVYLGPDFFGHVSLQLYGERLMNLVANRPELFVLWLTPVIWGVLRRDFTVFAGAGAVLPWFVLNISAVRGPPSELFTYYAFPFLVVFFWPLVVGSLRNAREPAAEGRLAGVPGHGYFLALGAAGLVLYATMPFGGDPGLRHARMHFASTFVPRVTPADFRNAAAAARMIEAAQASGQQVFADDGIMSLNPTRIVGRNRIPELPAGIASGNPWVLFDFVTYMQSPEIAAAFAGVEGRQCRMLPGSNIRVTHSADFQVPPAMQADLAGTVPCG